MPSMLRTSLLGAALGGLAMATLGSGAVGGEARSTRARLSPGGAVSASEGGCEHPAELALSAFHSQIEPFLRRFHDPSFTYDARDLRGHFASEPGAPTDLYAPADVVYILWIVDELDARTTAEGRAAWAELIRSYQDPVTGRFDRCQDCLLHTSTHATAFAVGALKLLGHAPRYPLRWVEDIFASRDTIREWLEGFRWQLVWIGSHEMGAAAALIDAPRGVKVPPQWGAWTLESLNALLDPNTAMWKRGLLDRFVESPTTNDLGGAAHFWWIYDHLGRSIPMPGRAIESILGVQYESGLWGSTVFGGDFPHGIDFDALNGYRLAWESLDAGGRARYKPAILASLKRYACAVDAHLNAEGAAGRLFGKPHKLVGTLNALAELNLLHAALAGSPAMATPRRWRSTLTVAAWQ